MENNQLARFDKLKADVTLYTAPALKLAVVDKDSQAVAMNSARQLVQWKKKVEETRKELIAPILEAQRQINDYAKSLTEPLLNAEGHVKKQLIEWDKKLEIGRQAELKRIEDEKKAKQKEIDAEVERKKEEAESLAMFGQVDDSVRQNLVAEAEGERKTLEANKEARQEEKKALDNRVSNIREVWKYEITDLDSIPDDFWIVDESAIGRAVRAGSRSIAGVRIYSEKTMAVR